MLLSCGCGGCRRPPTDSQTDHFVQRGQRAEDVDDGVWCRREVRLEELRVGAYGQVGQRLGSLVGRRCRVGGVQTWFVHDVTLNRRAADVASR
ncbi:MAG: hypothetical protein WKF65_18025 [Gaiellaceae bacterium]